MTPTDLVTPLEKTYNKPEYSTDPSAVHPLKQAKKSPDWQSPPHFHPQNRDIISASKPHTTLIDQSQREATREAKYGLTLPEPEFRHVSGDVRRRTDRVATADRPPANVSRSTQYTTTRQRSSQNRRRRRQNLGDGGSSDSESDDTNRNRKGRDDDQGSWGGIASTKQPLRVERPKDVSGRIAELLELEKEESDRVMKMRLMRRFEEKWSAIRDSRQEMQERSERRKKSLISYKEAFLEEKYQKEQLEELHGAITTLVADEAWLSCLRDWAVRLHKQQQDRLDEAFYHHVDDESCHHHPTGDLSWVSRDLLRKTIEKVETAFLERLYPLGYRSSRCLGLDPPPTLEANLVQAMQFLAAKCQDLQDARISLGSCRTTGIVTPLVTDRLVEDYCEKVLARLYLPCRSWLGVGPFDDFILASRDPHNNGELTDDYVEWVCSGIGLAELERSCLRVDAFEQFRSDRLIYHKMGTEQVFLLAEDDVRMPCLVTFKSDRAVSVKYLSAQDLDKVGWFPGGPRRPAYYWRFEYDAKHRATFKIREDGEVLGVYVGQSDFVDWGDRRFASYLSEVNAEQEL